MFNSMKAVIAMGIASLALNAQATEILIDDYTTGQGPLEDLVVDGVGVSSQANGGGLLGGYRDIYIEEIDNGLGSVDDSVFSGVRAFVDPSSGGRFNVALGSNVKGFAVITYDGMNAVGNDYLNGVDTDGLLGSGMDDWTGVTGVLFEGVTNDKVAPASLRVWTDDLDNGTYVEHILDFSTQGLGSGVLYDSFIDFSLFSDFGNINWAKVGAFQASFNIDSLGLPQDTVLDVDLSVSRATAIPEPASMAFMGFWLLVAGFAANRRGRNQS